MQHLSKLAITSVPALLLFSHQTLAYIGPGVGAGTLGVILGLIGSIFLALFAFFWYPIKRFFTGKGKKEKTPAETTAESSEQSERVNTQET
jgi:hypothetical protein